MIKLFELRSERELSQRQMAKVMNVSQGTYNNWENSNTQPSIEQLIALAKFFEVSVDYLIGNSESYSGDTAIGLKSHKILSLFNSADKEIQDAVLVILSHKK